MWWACLQKGYTPSNGHWSYKLTKWGQTVETGDLRYVRRRGLGSHDGELFFCWRHFFTEKIISTRRLLLFIPTGTRSERNTCGPCGPFFPRMVKKGKSWHRQTWLGSLICQVIFSEEKLWLLIWWEDISPAAWWTLIFLPHKHHMKNTWGYVMIRPIWNTIYG